MKWVRVEDELPEPGVMVLVKRCSGGMDIKYYLPPDGIHAWGWYPGGLPICNSSHWRPLPEGPED
jgi:hypothetical protein